MSKKIESRGFLGKLSLLFGGLIASSSTIVSNVLGNYKEQQINFILLK